MAFQQPDLMITLPAAADLSTHQFKFVKLDTSGQAAAIAAVTDRPVGVLQNKPNAVGKSATVMVIGITKLEGDANLAKGDLIGTSADGQADAKTPGTDTTNFICGQVIDDNAAAGGLASVLINCAAPARAA